MDVADAGAKSCYNGSFNLSIYQISGSIGSEVRVLALHLLLKTSPYIFKLPYIRAGQLFLFLFLPVF